MRTQNFAHPALEELVINAYYEGTNSLAALYPNTFKHSVPIVALFLAATAVNLFVLLSFLCTNLSKSSRFAAAWMNI